MKNNILATTAILTVLLASCAQDQPNRTGELSKISFDAWVSLNRESTWEKTPLGSWIVEFTPGDTENGSIASVEDNPFVRLEYTVSDLNGDISETTSMEISQRIGTYDKRTYYGPQFSYRGANTTYAGIEELFSMMGVGGHCKAVIPGWLLTNSRYSTEQEYINAMSSSTAAKIYDFTIVESVKATEDWELNLIRKTLGAEADKVDTLATGIFYIQDKASDKPDTTFSSSDQVYINYICRRIDGTGIDTNIADSAKVFGGTAKGEPVLINWAEQATGLTMTSEKTSVVAGFAYGIFNMKPHEKGRVYMTSSNAYGSSGSGTAIPAYSPIFFELEMVDKE